MHFLEITNSIYFSWFSRSAEILSAKMLHTSIVVITVEQYRFRSSVAFEWSTHHAVNRPIRRRIMLPSTAARMETTRFVTHNNNIMISRCSSRYVFRFSSSGIINIKETTILCVTRRITDGRCRYNSPTDSRQ